MLETLYILFWLYAILGYIMEVIRTLIREKKFVNRGFLLGPYCPIYGVGGVLLFLVNRYRSDPFIVFLVSIVICSFIEYIASYLLELIYKVRWWDYSDRLLNINGRICLTNTIEFGVLGMLIVCYFNPILIDFIKSINLNLRHVIAITLIVVTSLDILITSAILFDIRKSVLKFKNKTINIFKSNKDNTEEVSKKVKEMLKEKSFLHKHMAKAYDNLKVYKNNFLNITNKFINENNFNKLEDICMLVFSISIVLGLTIGGMVKKVGFCLCIFILIGIIIVRMVGRK